MVTLTKKIKKGLLSDDELRHRILDHIANGKTLKEIAELENVSVKSLYGWRNETIPLEWRQAEMNYQLSLAEEFSRSLMTKKASKKDTSLLSVQQREAEYLRDTLLNAKEKYNKAPKIAIQVNLPKPILDLGLIDSQKSLDIQGESAS